MAARRVNPLRSDNIAAMYSSTAIAMIFTSLTGVISVLIDGIIASRFLGSDVYSGIALLRPFTSVVMLLASFLSTGCSFVCSHQVGMGETRKANEAFNLASAIGLLFAGLLIFVAISVPDTVLRLCGVSLTKYPELNPHMYGYLRGLKRLYVYAMRFGFQITAVVAAAVIAAARPLVGIYTTDADVLNLAVFSIRWMAAGLVFDTVSALLQHYLQGIKSLRLLNVLCLGERFAVPVATAFVLGRFYGTKGILASAGISKFVLILLLFLYVCSRRKGLPRRWEDMMFLPESFGGEESDNLYAVIRTPEDAIRESSRAHSFCLQHGTDPNKAPAARQAL